MRVEHFTIGRMDPVEAVHPRHAPQPYRITNEPVCPTPPGMSLAKVPPMATSQETAASLHSLITRFNHDEATNILVGSLGRVVRRGMPFNLDTLLQTFANRRATYLSQSDLKQDKARKLEEDQVNVSVSLLHPGSKVRLFASRPRMSGNDLIRTGHIAPRLPHNFDFSTGYILEETVEITHAFPCDAHSDNLRYTPFEPRDTPDTGKLYSERQGKRHISSYAPLRDKAFRLDGEQIVKRDSGKTLAALRRHHAKHGYLETNYTEVLVVPGEQANRSILSFFIDFASTIEPLDNASLNQYLYCNREQLREFDRAIGAFPLTAIYNDIDSGRRKIAYIVFDEAGTPVTSDQCGSSRPAGPLDRTTHAAR